MNHAAHAGSRNPLLARRVWMTAVGILLTGIGVGFLKRAQFGVDPAQCYVNGLANVFPIRYGALYALVNLVQLIAVFFLDRRYIGMGTLMNLFLLGYVIEFSESALAALFGAPGPAVRVLFLGIGVVVMCAAAAMYFSADLGVSTYDAIALGIADRKPRLFGRVLPFKAVRMMTDAICTVIGVALGARAGVGTIITALFMGPLIAFFRRALTDPMARRA